MELEAKVAEMAPKAEVHDGTMDLGDTMTMTSAAKMLGIDPEASAPRWLTHDFIPAIRRTVGYRTDPDKDNHPSTCPPAT